MSQPDTDIRGDVRKVVTFNLDNEEDRRMYAYAQKINFTRLVKRYLSTEMRNRIVEQKE